ncbi:[FeFe] hydrogenase H-cluster maturation GTPase HydF [Clostridia bacterium]|nr:[FeFe] hydrogenase H-cluster maturation GTPase HydF [Clostridia bacterium]
MSAAPGTTTDPVSKAMELLPIGPVLLIDTAGIDDSGALGALRIERTRTVLRKTDVALLVVDASEGLRDEDRELIETFERSGVKYLVVYNKSDLAACPPQDGFSVSAATGAHIHELKEKIAEVARGAESNRRLCADLLTLGDTVVLVIPIDSAAPKGRLILPQQQVLRDVLEAGATAVVTRESELCDTLKKLVHAPKLVVTDSQAFGQVSKETPPEVGLTSFSILMARYKGVLDSAVQGAFALDTVGDGDKILISEGCTHHRQCDDIGTVKLPRWIRQHTKANPIFEFTSGGGFPADLSPYKVVVHCGGCMLGAREMLWRERAAREAGVPMTNYGIVISHTHGILKRAIAPLGI